MAQQLRAGGEAVDLLALFDTDLHPRHLPFLDWLAYQGLVSNRVREQVRAMPARSRLSFFLRKTWHRLMVRARIRDEILAETELTGAMADRQQLMYALGTREFRAFKPEPYDGRLCLFRTSGVRSDACDPVPIWRRVATSFELFEIVGAHIAIMERPHVEMLAAQFSRCLGDM